MALKFKKGEKINLEEALAYPAIYRDARKGEVVSNEELQKFFGTVDVLKVAEEIVRKGEVQLTTEQRREMVEKKRVQIANIISKMGVNPQTNLPHPPQRILNAMEQAGVSIDPFEDAEVQVDRVVKSIRSIIPIKLQKVVVQVKIPSTYSGKAYHLIKESGDVVEEKWLDDGSLQVNVEIPAGIQDDFFGKVSSLTHGNFESKVVKKVDV